MSIELVNGIAWGMWMFSVFAIIIQRLRSNYPKVDIHVAFRCMWFERIRCIGVAVYAITLTKMNWGDWSFILSFLVVASIVIFIVSATTEYKYRSIFVKLFNLEHNPDVVVIEEEEKK